MGVHKKEEHCKRYTSASTHGRKMLYDAHQKIEKITIFRVCRVIDLILYSKPAIYNQYNTNILEKIGRTLSSLWVEGGGEGWGGGCHREDGRGRKSKL
jgi:hypothetical protein